MLDLLSLFSAYVMISLVLKHISIGKNIFKFSYYSYYSSYVIKVYSLLHSYVGLWFNIP